MRTLPSSDLPQHSYFRAWDRVVVAPMTDAETARLSELREVARTVGIGGAARGEYVLLCQVEAEHRRRG